MTQTELGEYISELCDDISYLFNPSDMDIVEYGESKNGLGWFIILTLFFCTLDFQLLTNFLSFGRLM